MWKILICGEGKQVGKMADKMIENETNYERLINIAKHLIADDATCMSYNYKDKDLPKVPIGELVDDVKTELVGLYTPICGCGDPNLCIKETVRLLKAIEDIDSDGKLLHEYYGVNDLYGWVGSDWCRLMVLYMMNEQDLITHGSSVFNSFITDNGKDFIFVFETYGEDIN